MSAHDAIGVARQRCWRSNWVTLIWTSRASFTTWIMGSSSGPSTITRTIQGSGCTSRGGCVSPRRNPAEPGRNGAGAHHKGVSLRSGSKSYDSWIVLSWRGCAGSIGASGAGKPKRAASWSELLNLIAITERQLRRVMRSYVDYCREDRTHLGLEKDVPEERSIEPREMGEVVAMPRVGGLHRRYSRELRRAT